MSVSKITSLPDSISSSAQLYSVVNYISALIKKANTMNLIKSANISELGVSLDYSNFNYFTDKSTTIQDLDEIKNKILSLTQSSKSVVVTLSDYPEDRLKKKLVGWFREIDPFILVDFQIDQAIIGGFRLRTVSKKFDLSFLNSLKIDETKFNRILNNVV